MSLENFERSRAEQKTGHTPSVKEAPSLVCGKLSIRGNVISDGDIQINSSIEGGVRGYAVVIGSGGNVHGDVVGESVTIYGTVVGTVLARNLLVYSTGHVDGTVIYGNLKMLFGARINGECRSIQTLMPMRGRSDASVDADPQSLAAE